MNINFEKIELKEGKKIYFASDFHLGAPAGAASAKREKQIVAWLSSIQSDMQALFLVGDVFDFWFEYSYTIPKGYARFQGKLAELADAGVQIYFFPGNHDMWMFDYFSTEFGAKIYRKPLELHCNNSRFFINHGDGIGPGDYFYKLLKILFESKVFQFIFTLFPTNFCYWIAQNWSKKSRISNLKFEEKFLGDNEWLWQFAKNTESLKHFDYYIFGHRHLVLNLPVGINSRYINLGEWFSGTGNFTVFDGKTLEMKTFIFKN